MIEGTPGTAFEGEVTVRRIRFAGEDGGFAVLDAERDGDELVLVGPIAHLEERERARIRGTWQDDRRFGMQIRVATAEPLAPSGDAALLAYLKRVKHVGDGRAKQLLARHGPDVLEAIDADPHGALRAVGLNPRRTNEAVRSWHGLRSSRALHLQLAPHGLAWLVPRITKEHGERAHLVVRERPYELTSVFGVGFRIADTIARAGGVAPDAPARTRAAVVHVLAEAERDGSTCLPVAELATRAAALLDGPPPDAALLGAMADDGQLVVEVDDEAWAYRPATGRWRRSSPSGSASSPRPRPSSSRPARCATQELEPGARAGRRGRGGVRAPALGRHRRPRHRQDRHDPPARRGRQGAAGQGRARRADRPRRPPDDRVDRVEATTIHAALGWIPGQGPTVDEIDAQLLIVDETSMANLELLVTLLRAVGGRTHVVLVGDADQLAPVGAGKPFAELVAARAVPVAELTHIFRQAAGSMIVRGAHAVRHGEPPSFRADGGDAARPVPDRPRRPARRAGRDRLARRGAPARVLRDRPRPRHPGLRARLPRRARDRRAQRAPARGAQPDGKPVLGGRLRLGDKLMLSGRNLHELGLMNGTCCGCSSTPRSPRRCSSRRTGSPSRCRRRRRRGSGSPTRARSTRARGSSCRWRSSSPTPPRAPFFLRREMLYTAMTRARTATLVVGQEPVVARAAATPDTSRRHSRLGARLTAR